MPSCFSLGVNGLMKLGSLGSLGGLSRLPSGGGSFGLPRLSQEVVRQGDPGPPPASGANGSAALEGARVASLSPPFCGHGCGTCGRSAHCFCALYCPCLTLFLLSGEKIAGLHLYCCLLVTSACHDC